MPAVETNRIRIRFVWAFEFRSNAVRIVLGVSPVWFRSFWGPSALGDGRTVCAGEDDGRWGVLEEGGALPDPTRNVTSEMKWP